MARAFGHIRLDARMERPEPSMSLDSTTPAFQSVQNILLQKGGIRIQVANTMRYPLHVYHLP